MGGLKWFSLSSAQAYIWCLASSCTSPLRERERQRPMMRHWIKGRDRLFPTAATALRVTECKKKKKKGVVHCQLSGWVTLSGLVEKARGQVLRLPLSELSGDKEGLASSWVCRLSISAFLLSRSCWRLLISACGCHTVRKKKKGHEVLQKKNIERVPKNVSV